MGEKDKHSKKEPREYGNIICMYVCMYYVFSEKMGDGKRKFTS